MQIELEKKGGYGGGSYWRATVQEGGYEAVGESWTRRWATRRAVRKLRRAADVRWTLAQAVNIEERAALAYEAAKPKAAQGVRKPRTPRA